MKSIAIGLSLAALAIAGAALAEQTAVSGQGMERSWTRADALARADRLFSKLDVNGDGKLDPADREARRAARFDRIDSNKDGQISRAEFSAMRPGMGRRGMGGHEAHDAGHDAGRDGRDGAGMADDQKDAGHRGGRGMHHGRMGGGMGGMMLMHMADSNRDGTVSKAEFTAAAANRFDTSDTNRDGQLTPEERQAARAMMRERMHSMKQHAMPGGDAAAPPPAQ